MKIPLAPVAGLCVVMSVCAVPQAPNPARQKYTRIHGLQVPVSLGDYLILDATTYEFWYQTRYDSTALYVRYGADDLMQDSAAQLPLLKWAKAVTRLLVKDCH